jgi:phage gp16-like protein
MHSKFSSESDTEVRRYFKFSSESDTKASFFKVKVAKKSQSLGWSSNARKGEIANPSTTSSRSSRYLKPESDPLA